MLTHYINHMIDLGKCLSIEKNHVEQTQAKKGDEVAVKIGLEVYDQAIVFGRGMVLCRLYVVGSYGTYIRQ